MNEIDEFHAKRAKERRAQSERPILRVRAGSHLYGTNTPESDEDFVSVWVPTEDQMLGLGEVQQIDVPESKSSRKGHVTPGQMEETRYPLHLFIKHALKCNPNILEIFSADAKNVVVESDSGRALRRALPAFLNKKVCYDTFRGYAAAQKRKLEYKRERLLAFTEALDLTRKMREAGFDRLPEKLSIGNGPISGDGQWKTYEKGQTYESVENDIITTLEEYGWRRELIVKYGWDTKFASHLIRILTEGIDLMKHGQLVFPLHNAKELLAIKQGKASMTEVLQYATELEAKFDEAYAQSTLPECANYERVNNVLVGLFKYEWEKDKVTAGGCGSGGCGRAE